MKKTAVIFFAVAILFSSCTKESLKNIYNNQEKNIEKLINSLIEADTTGTVHSVGNGGSQRVVMYEGSGDALTSSGTVSFYYAGYALPSSTIAMNNLFDTNVFDVAKAAGRDTTDLTVFEPYTIKLSSGKLIKGLKNGLVGVKAGEQCYVMFSGKYGYGDMALGTIPANSALVYALQIVSVQEDD